MPSLSLHRTTGRGQRCGDPCRLDDDGIPERRARPSACKTLVVGKTNGRGNDDPVANPRSSVQELLALLALDALPETSVLAFDADFRFVVARGGAMLSSGVSPAEFEGKLARETLDPERWKIYEPHYRAALNGESSSLEVLSPDGDRTFLIHIGPLGLDRVVGGILVATDISALRKAQQSERRLASIVQFSEDAILSIDLEGRVTSWNAGAERLFGFGAEEVIGTSILRGLPDDRAEEATRIWEDVSSGKRAHPVDSQRLHKDGHPVDISAAVSPIFDGNGAMIGVSAVVRDIGDRRSAELERAKAEQSRDELFSRVSHELRTPLHGILSSADLLALDDLTSEQTEGVEHIRAAARVLADLIDELLDISVSESKTAVLALEPVRAGDVIDDVVGITGATAHERNVRLVVGTIEAPPLLGNRKRLEQVLLNLVSNGIKFSSDDGIVTVSCTPSASGAIRIDVSNTGPGIAPTMLDRVFQPFERLDAGMRGIPGTGIGLTFTKSMVEAMGGTIAVTSEIGRCTTFTVTLPAAPV